VLIKVMYSIPNKVNDAVLGYSN